MIKEMTINDATHKWVGEFNAIPQGMIERLMRDRYEEWEELTMAEGFIADFDDTSEWQRYLNYLADWVFSHISEEFAGMSPVCFDEWRDNEEQEVNQDD